MHAHTKGKWAKCPYCEPILFKKLFKRFHNNLHKAETLLIIGYGGKDTKINEMLQNHFDFEAKHVYIFDPYPSDALKEFASSVRAKVIEKSVSDFTMQDIE